jgi:hypothetical protein
MKPAKMADSLRRELVKQRESFVFETVFSDPAGDKLALLEDAATAGYTVIALSESLAPKSPNSV